MNIKKFAKRIKSKFIKPVVMEETLPDLSIWNMSTQGNPTTPVYIETVYISEQSNEFRKDYRKVIMSITTLDNGNHVPACRKLYNIFVAKWQLDELNPNSKSTIHRHDELLRVSVCGYIESLLQQLETMYAYVCTPTPVEEVI